MNSARYSKARVRPWFKPESPLHVALAILFPLAGLLLTGCAGLFQRSLPSAPDRWAHRAVGPFSAGFAEADITPVGSVYMGGFNLAKTSTGLESRLKVRAAVFVVGGRKIALVGVDNLGLLREDVDWIKSGLTGFANGDVFIASSHTHAGPDLIGLWGWYFLTSGRDVECLALVRQGIVSAVAEAERRARPATLWQGQTRIPDTVLVKNSNRAGVFNRRFTVLQARDRSSGESLGALLHFACHPEMMRRNHTLISADMVGALCERWREAGHGQAVFFNGEIGAMVTPAYRPRGPEGMAGVGQLLLEIAERARADAREIRATDLEVRRRDIFIPLITPGLVFGRLTGAIRRELYDGSLRTSVGYLRIGTFEAISVPGEIEPVLAEEIRRALGRPRLLVFGLVDDEVGYLMREIDAADKEFAYERTMSPCRTAGEMIRNAFR